MTLSEIVNAPGASSGILFGLIGVLAFVLLATNLVPSYLRRKSYALPDYAALTGVPAPQPIPDFDVETTKARPYRPFRWEYFQHMSLSNMDPDRWIELESTYRERIQQRVHLYSQHDKKVIDALPGSEVACKELMEMVIQFVCARYPNLFRYDSQTGIFYNHILDVHSDTKTIQPLLFLLHHIPEDFLITLEDKKTGLYAFRAGVSCSAIGWNVSTKIGLYLHQIHKPVPDYKEKMQMSMDRFFSKMPSNKPIQRGSWGIEIGQPLFFQEDDPEFKLSRASQSPDLDVKDIHLRVDWQTLRRLPRSRAIVFNFKALFTPITDFREERYIPRLLLKILRDGKPSLMAYKAAHHVEHKVLPALEQWAKEQEEKGWVPKDWKERTLDQAPFFPGWESRL